MHELQDDHRDHGDAAGIETGTRFVQCVSCHDPHNQRLDPTVGKSLVKSNEASAICVTCRRPSGTGWSWSTSSHAVSAKSCATASTGGVPGLGAHTGYVTVADNGCESCHRPHSAPQAPQGPHGSTNPYMLAFANGAWSTTGPMLSNDTGFCFNCHNPATALSTNNVHSVGSHATRPCQACHAVSPHGSFRIGLIALASDPAPYNMGAARITAFTPASGPRNYSQRSCSTASGCD